MAEGTSTFMGRGVGLRGNYEIQGDNDTDDTLTITGASSSAAGDILVLQNSTGTEFAAMSSSGLFSVAGSYGITTSKLAVTATGATAYSGQISAVLSSTLQSAAISVSITSTGAIAAGARLGSGVRVVLAASAAIQAAFMLDMAGGGDAYIGTANYMLAVAGSKFPLYFFGAGATALGVGNAPDAQFIDTGLLLTSALATSVAMAGFKVQLGDSVWYIPLVPTSALK